ncbi:uncharacterized protein CBL_20880, partial [Carabus blaptoides fortunei]
MDDINEVLTDSEDEINFVYNIHEPRRAKILRERKNHFEEWDEIDFLNRFRLSKDTVRRVLEQIKNAISNPTNRFESGEMGNNVLVGDSGYPIKKYLITPLLNPQTPPEHLFNESQICTRNSVERSYGVWKRRFPVLSLGLRLKLVRIEAVIIATAVLHNIACEMNETLPPINQEQEDAIEFMENMPNYEGFEVGGINN